MSSAAVNWYTAAELAELRLPGLPDSKRRVYDLAANDGWADRKAQDGSPLCRRRAAKGGPTEYHFSLLPDEAQALLTARLVAHESVLSAANDTTDGEADNAGWDWYRQQSSFVRAKAEERFAALVAVDALVMSGLSKTAAVEEVGRQRDFSPRAIAEWSSLVAGVRREDWLPRLAPRYKPGGRTVAIPDAAWEYFKTDYLRGSKPAAAASYTRLIEEWARPNGIDLPCLKTFTRRLSKEVHSDNVIAKREGKEPARRAARPPLKRSVMGLHALEMVNVDGHKFDVWVRMENGDVIRPIMCGIQDVYSRKLLAYRIGESENIELVRLTFFDLFRECGLPSVAFMDNGRAFASKEMTGGAKTRFRFKINPDDLTGVLPSLGVEPRFVLPYRGQSKPIERAWRDLCEYVSKHPAMDGAYTGNSPSAKPDNAGTRAIPIADFRKHVAHQIALHNARLGRRTESAKAAGKAGSSFDLVFSASFEASVIRRATEEQLRLAFLSRQTRTCHKEHGAVDLFGNTYWCEELRLLRGQKVIVRFDPDDLHSSVDIYALDGKFICDAPVDLPIGYADQRGAVLAGKREAQARKSRKKFEQDMQRYDEARYQQIIDGPVAPNPKPKAGAVKPTRPRGQTAAALKPTQQPVFQEAQEQFFEKFNAAMRLRLVEH